MVAPSRTKDKPCKSCPALLRRDNRSGYCRQCVKATPEFRAKVAEGAKRRYADPAERERTGEAVRRANQADPTISQRKSAAMQVAASDPAWQARNAEQCRARRLWESGVAARTPASDAKAGRTFSRRHGYGAWCPEDYIAHARDLRRTGLSLDETKAAIAEQVERDRQRLRARAAATAEKRMRRDMGLDLARRRMGLDE